MYVFSFAPTSRAFSNRSVFIENAHRSSVDGRPKNIECMRFQTKKRWPGFHQRITISQGHTHAQNGIFDSILDTGSPQPNDKQDGGLGPPYCFWYVRMRSGSKWPMIGPRPCAYACAYVDPVFTGQSYDINISTRTRRTNLSVFLVLTLMSTQFSLVYTCASALCLCLCAYGNQALVWMRIGRCVFVTTKTNTFENALVWTGP